MPTPDETPAASTLVGSKVICDELGINRSTLSRWVADGRIRPASRVGGFVFWREDYDKLKAEMMNLPQATQGESAEPPGRSRLRGCASWYQPTQLNNPAENRGRGKRTGEAGT